MKIICARCKKILGEQEPFDNPVEIKAKCTTCIAKEKEAASRFVPKPVPGQKQEIILGSGLKGILWVAEDKTEKLFIGDMVVSGKKFFCSKSERTEFQNYLESITGEEADVTALHSMTCKINIPKGRRKKQDSPEEEEPKKDDSVLYYCTIRAPKHYVQAMFDNMAERMDRVTEILAEAALRAYNKEHQKVTQNGGLAQVAGQKE